MVFFSLIQSAARILDSLGLHRDNEAETPQDVALLELARAVLSTGYAFSTLTPLSQARVNARPENSHACDLAGIFGWSRSFSAEIISPHLFALMQAADVVERCGDGWRARIRISTLGDKAYVHSSYPTDGADAVFFGPDTVRFVDAIERHLDAVGATITRAADVGCGAGPGGIYIAARTPSACVSMIDINDAALRLARINARLNGALNAVARKSDILKQVQGDFDLIVSNPPYLIDSLGRAYRHGGGRLGEGLSAAILREALSRLAPGGRLVLYTGVAIVEGRDPFKAICVRHIEGRPFDWSYREVDPDVFGEELEGGAYAGADRIAAVVVTVRRREGGYERAGVQ